MSNLLNNATNNETAPTDNTNNSSNEVQEEIEFTLDDIFVNLTLISRIEVGNKLIRNDKHVNIDTSFFPSITRWLYGQNHVDILKFINTILNKAFYYNDVLTKDTNEESRQNLIRLNNTLSNVINGLSNLMQTYNYDKLTQSSIEVMINTIRDKLNLQLKHIHYVYNENKNHTKSNITNLLPTIQEHNIDETNETNNENNKETLSNSLTLNTNNIHNEKYKVKDSLDSNSHTNITNNNPQHVSYPKKKKSHT